ncbi:MAG: hypothetical protein H7Y04_08645, partial [Verrucomicrobia bacterium]|nr:hypothetical protein [Cytophagales bacterium]
MLTFYLSHYFICIIALSFFYLIGFFILRFTKPAFAQKGFFSDVFFSLFIGLTIFVTLYALLKTQFHSIHILFLLIAIFSWLEHQKFSQKSDSLSPTPVFKADWKQLLMIFTGFSLVFTFNSLLTLKEVSVPDHIFYSRIAYYINLTGEENDYYIANVLDKNFRGATPYHFYELWLAGALTSV